MPDSTSDIRRQIRESLGMDAELGKSPIDPAFKRAFDAWLEGLSDAELHV